MFNFISKIMGQSANYAELVKNGAIIVDVRTPAEFGTGHVEGSVNIPLGGLLNSISRIPKDRPVITCCASGMRSAQAKSILKEQGYLEVHNGGGWMALARSLQDRSAR